MENFLTEESYQSVWYYTELPSDIINIITSDLKKYESETFLAAVGDNGKVSTDKRNSNVFFIPPHNWLIGFCYNYILHANNTNFRLDINGFDHNQMQYTEYGPGQFYGWHIDVNKMKIEKEVRKLSFTLQLSDPDEYEGGEFQLLSYDNELYTAPKQKGTLIIFDSMSRHRVTKIKSGLRKSLVGWVLGPRWK